MREGPRARLAGNADATMAPTPWKSQPWNAPVCVKAPPRLAGDANAPIVSHHCPQPVEVPAQERPRVCEGPRACLTGNTDTPVARHHGPQPVEVQAHVRPGVREGPCARLVGNVDTNTVPTRWKSPPGNVTASMKALTPALPVT